MRAPGSAGRERVRVWVELSAEKYRRYAGEAERRGVPTEALIEQTVNCLMRELEEAEQAGTDHPITIS